MRTDETDTDRDLPSTADDIVEEDIELVDWPTVNRLTDELKDQVKEFGRRNVGMLVADYYRIQHVRQQFANCITAANDAKLEPSPIWLHLRTNEAAQEVQVRDLLGFWALQHTHGRWMQSLYGVGPVISAGMIAHLDIHKATTAGAFWTFAGLNPTQKWLGKDKAEKLVKEVLGRKSGKLADGNVETVAAACNRRADTFHRLLKTGAKDGEPMPDTVASLTKIAARKPWNARLKTLCWKFAVTQEKFANRGAFYGPLGAEYKARLHVRNQAGDFAEAAAEVVRTKPGHAQRAIYKKGLLPDGHIRMRALRWVSKLFLSHLHSVMWECEFDKPSPRPFVIEHLNHTGMIEVPGWPMREETAA